MVFLKILLLHCFRHSACQMVIMQIADVPAPNKMMYNSLSFYQVKRFAGAAEKQEVSSF